MNMNQGTHTSEIWVSATRPSLISPKFPDLSFSCSECGSLDVFITKGKENNIMTCLDCKKMEEIK
jgi:hypothetical protein